MAIGREYEIAFKLGAELESTFAKTFSKASADFKALQAYVKQLNKDKGPADTTKSVRNDLKQTQKEFRNTESAASRMINNLKKAGTVVAGFFAVRKIVGVGQDVVRTFADFEQGLANVRAVSGATTEEMKKLAEIARKLGATTAWSAKEVTDAEVLLAQAGFSVSETISALPGLLSLASADQLDLATATDIAAGTLRAFGMAAEEATHVADVLALSATKTNSDVAGIGEAMKYVAPVAKSLGIDVEQTAAAIGLLSNANIKASQAGTVLRAGLTRLASPSGEAAKVIKKLGFSAFDAQGKMLPLDEVIGRLRKSTEKLTEQQRADAISTIFGQEAMSGILALMEQGSDALRQLTNELYKSEGAAKRMADTRLDSLTGSFTILKSAIEGAKIQLGEKFAPVVRKAVDWFANWLPKAMDKFEKSYQAMVNSPDWKNADWLEKIQIAWDRIVAKPFKEWWSSTGKEQVSRVATEIGKTIARIIKGLIAEAFSFNGTSSLLAAGALAIPGVKVGRGIAGTVRFLKNFGKAGVDAAEGVSKATKATGLLGSALGILTNPVGLAVAGVGLLTAGVIAYRKHQEKMRQELIHMGDALRKAQSKYQEVADKAELTKSLTAEYRELDQAVRNNLGTTEELAEKQQRMAEITALLQEMFPQTITNYDIENGKIKEKLELLDQETEAEKELARLRLEKKVAEESQKLPGLEKEIQKLQKQKKSAEELKDAYDVAIPKLKSYAAELEQIYSSPPSAENGARLQEIRTDVQEIGKSIGVPIGLANFGDTIKRIEKMRVTVIDNQIKKIEELNSATASYEELYNAQKRLIELDLGGKLEEQAKKFKDLTIEEKERFQQALSAVRELNRQMDLLDESKKINVEVLLEQSGLTSALNRATEMINGGIFRSYREEKAKQATQIFRPQMFAEGGIATRPSIFGEAGPEIAIPLNNKPRSHALLETANRLMGHDIGSNIQITFAPQITVYGGDPEVKKQVDQALQQAQDDFERRFKAMIKNERRLSFR